MILPSFWSILSFIGIHYACAVLAVSNGSTLALETDAAAGITEMPPDAAISPSPGSVLQASASCSTCKGGFIVDGASWWDIIETRTAATILLVVDNSTNTTSTSTITAKPPQGEIGSVYTFAVDGETVFLTYPTSYNIYYLYERSIASLAYVTSVNESLVEPYYTCTDETLYYTNIFALPVGGGTSAAAYSSYDLFASSIGLRAQTKNCQYSVYGHPTILTSVSLLTATSTSFGSFPTAPAIGPSLPPRADSPIASQTEFQPSKPTQGISDETLQEKLPDATQVAVPATTTALQEGSSWPTKSQPVPNEPVPIQNPNENPEGNTSGKSEVTPILIPEIPVGKGSFSAVPSSATTPRPIPTFGDIEITSNGQNEFIVGSQTRVPGGPAGLSLAPIRIGPSATAVVIGGSTIELVASKPSSGVGAAVFTLPGDRIITASSAATFEYIIDNQSLTPGGSISVLGTKIHLASSASEIIIGSQTVQLHPLAPLPQPIIIGGQTLTAQSDRSDYIIDDQTLTPGRTITVSGTPIYLAPSASEVVVGSQTIKLQPPTPYSHPIIIGGQPLTYQSERSGYIINGQTLQPGSQAVTIAGTPVILAPSLSVLIVGGSSTIPLITALPTLTIAGKTILPNSASEYIIDGQTLKPGSPAITVSGTVISLAPSASALVVGGTKTIPLLTPGAASTLQPGLADLILGGFNTPTSATSPADVTVTKNASQAILGQSASMRLSLRRLICITIITVVIGICNWV